jgi:hypothetical protein
LKEWENIEGGFEVMGLLAMDKDIQCEASKLERKKENKLEYPR